jgi:putative NADH-flavin reductase
MRVLLLGVTGKVGCRLFPALVAHNHTVVAYVRNPAKVSEDVASRASSIMTGCATNSDALTEAMLSHRCDAVINAAGFAVPFGKGGELPSIHSAVSKAAQAARVERGGPPLRCWFLSGWPLMDSPNVPHTIMD